MKKAVIWDLDGTLLDSYDVIVESLLITFSKYGISCKKEEIHRHIIAFSISSLFSKYAAQTMRDVRQLNECYSAISAGMYLDIKVMEHGREVLQALADQGVEQYVFTHRGKTTIPVLDNLGLTGYFRDIITSQQKFARKPDPEGLQYLIDKCGLDQEHTFYVGDRSLDMECAHNANICGILYKPMDSFCVTGKEAYIVEDLLDIVKII